MSHLSTTVRVEAPAEIVYDIVADPWRGPEWQTLVSEIGGVAGRPGGVGSSYVGYYRLAGRRVEGRFIITAAERPTLLQSAGTTRGGWTRWTTLIEALEDGAASQVNVTLEYELPGEVVGSLFGMLSGNRLEAEFNRSYRNLKRVAEQAVPGGAVRAVENRPSSIRRRPSRDDRAGPKSA
jgi:polyketide cyclase/dehydrase/lipid transport protein